MGSIFEARHEFLGTEVALKFLHPALSSRPHVVARFVQEARVSANIKSPHVVGVIDVDQSPEGLAFLVMELLHGEPLSSRLAREPVLPLPLVVNISLQILLALETAHGLGVVHRDMKPENVFLTDAPGDAGANSQGLLVKILDFGIAKLRTLGEVRAQLTRPGVVMGTPEYMSPEQVFAADAVDARADLYALGAMCFEMLAGRRPVQGDDARSIAAQVMAGMTPRLESVVPSVPTSVCDVVAIALSAKPQDRFTSATAMRQALVHAAREAEVAIDAPQAALRTRAPSPSALDIANAQGVLGGVGLGVAPPAMLGPGNPAAMAAWDARQASGEAPVLSPQQVKAKANGGSHEPVAATPPPPPVPALPPPTPPSPMPAEDRGGTLAAMPSPYAPPYGPLEADPPPRGFDGGSTAHGAAPPTSPSGTDAGMLSPFQTDPNFRPETVLSSAQVETPPVEQPVSRAGGPPWALILGGVVLIGGLVALVIWATRPSSSPAPPTPAPTATASDDDDTPKKKKPKPEPTTTSEPTTAPTPKPTITVKPTAKPSVSTKPSTSVSTIPTPSVSTKPPTSASVPDIIPLPPLPWPPPGM